MIHFPMTMGYRNCYKRYMASLDYNISSTAQGGLIVTGVGGKAVDSREYVSLTTYYYKWKQLYPHLKVSRPAEDICQYCYAFCNRHRYLRPRRPAAERMALLVAGAEGSLRL
jgi:hypothetical protein